MTGYGRLGVATLFSACLVAGAAHAQALQHGEVLGNWTLRMIPVEGGESRITVKTATGRLEQPLTVTARGRSGILCMIDGDAADCRLRRGELVVTLRMDDARMIYTLTSRRGGGFAGNTRMTLPLLPFGSVHLGAAEMVRR